MAYTFAKDSREPNLLGCYIDGSLGDEYLRARLGEVLCHTNDGHEVPRISSMLMDDSPEVQQEGIDAAMERLQEHTEPGLVWILESGDLTLTTESESE